MENHTAVSKLIQQELPFCTHVGQDIMLKRQAGQHHTPLFSSIVSFFKNLPNKFCLFEEPQQCDYAYLATEA